MQKIGKFPRVLDFELIADDSQCPTAHNSQ